MIPLQSRPSLQLTDVVSSLTRQWVALSNINRKMATNETVLLKSTLEIQNKAYTVKLTATEIYWEFATSARAAGGPYSEPLVSKSRVLQAGSGDKRVVGELCGKFHPSH